MCRELNLEDSLDELMRELGADEQGRISYQEFLRRRLALRPEIDALRGGDSTDTQVHCRGTPEYLPTSSDNSLGKIFVFSRPRLHSERGLLCYLACSVHLDSRSPVCLFVCLRLATLKILQLATLNVLSSVCLHSVVFVSVH